MKKQDGQEKSVKETGKKSGDPTRASNTAGNKATATANKAKAAKSEVKTTTEEKSGKKNSAAGKRQKDADSTVTDGHDKKQAKKSRAKATMEKLLELYKENKGRTPSYRLVHAHMGGSHGTIGKLLHQLNEMNNGKIDIEIVLSLETQEAIEKDIQRHLALYRETLSEREQAIAEVKEDIELLVNAFEALYNNLAD